MAIFQVHRLVGVAFAAALCWRLGDRGSALLALSVAAVGWVLEWRALDDLARVRGIDVDEVLRDRRCRPSAATCAIAGLGGLAVLLAMCGVDLGFGLGRLAALGAGLLVLAHDTSSAVLAHLLPTALAAKVARAWDTNLPSSALARLLRGRGLALCESGVLTRGKPRVTEVVAHGELRAVDVLRAAAALLRPRSAALTEAVLEAARTYRLALPKVDDLLALPGEGLLGHIAGQPHAVGGPSLARRLEVALPDALTPFLATPVPCRRVLLVMADQQVLGWLVIEDAPRHSGMGLVPALLSSGVEPLTLVAEVDCDEIGSRLADVAFETVIPLAPAAQPEDAGVGRLPHEQVVVVAARDAALLAGHGLLLVVTEGDEELPEQALAALPAERLSVLPMVYGLARRQRAKQQRLARMVGWSRALLCATALLAVPLGTLVLADELLLLLVMAAVRHDASVDAVRALSAPSCAGNEAMAQAAAA
ncbi:MAG: hypothetical protein HZB16_03395 [Armatimonadetes bacterium]|nr:hypothetical protein [Armatimonadota bacterium]